MVKSNSRQGKHREFKNIYKNTGKTKGIYKIYIDKKLKSRKCAQENCCVTLMIIFFMFKLLFFYYKNTQGKLWEFCFPNHEWTFDNQNLQYPNKMVLIMSNLNACTYIWEKSLSSLS